jgi:hypothetical protein
MWDYLATKHLGLMEGEGRYSSQPAILGLVERSLYFGSLVFNASFFIGVWLTLKTVAKSPRWANEDNIMFREVLNFALGKPSSKRKSPPGRALFQPFLVGNGLSILYSGAGYAIVLLSTKLDHLEAGFLWAATLGPILISLLAYIFSLVPLIKEKKFSWRLIVKHISGLDFTKTSQLESKPKTKAKAKKARKKKQLGS